MAQGSTTPERAKDSQPSKARRAAGAFGLLFVVIAGVFAMNWSDLRSPLADAVGEDRRNAGFEISVHYGSWLDRSTIVFDIRATPAEFAPADVLRIFLQFAAATKDLDVENVELARSGDVRFLLSGSDFKTLGDEYGEQNPMFTLRTFPEKLRRPDGSAAFEAWEGGALGVAGKQLEDFTAMVKTWTAGA